MADFQLKVTAETQDAEKKLQQVDKVATEATRKRDIRIDLPNYKDVSNDFKTLSSDIEGTANTIKQFYKVAAQLPIGPAREINEMASSLKRVGETAMEAKEGVSTAGGVLNSTFSAAGKVADSLVGKLTRIALSLYVLSEAAQVVNQSFSGMFNETVGREIKLRETILKTQSTLASTNAVFRNGKEITDPYQKIVSLTGEVNEHINSIRERSIALAGVTSGEVIEVFGMVASQVGQIGGGLKEAEDLAINFAAALGTFGIPLYQARQEIGSILRGDITTDSYLAKALGITNNDVAKAKTQAGGIVKFLEDRLAASVAGQRIAAEGFAGVVSNIRDIQELVGQSFGAGLLDPLLSGLTQIFDFLFKIRKELLAVSNLAGKTIGTVASVAIGTVAGASGVSRDPEGKARAAMGATERGITSIAGKVNSLLASVWLQLATLTERAAAAFGSITQGLAALAYGLVSIKLEQLKALISTLESVSPALLGVARATGTLLGAWGQFMQLPVVQFVAQIATGMKLLSAVGITQFISSLLMLKGIITFVMSAWPRIAALLNNIRTIIGGIVAGLGALMVQVARTGAAMLQAWSPQAKALQAVKFELTQIIGQLQLVGTNAQAAGEKLGGLQRSGSRLGGGIVGLVAGMIKFQVLMFVITAAISLVTNAFGKWKEAQDKIAADNRAELAIQRLSTTYKDVTDASSAATKRQRDYEQALVDARYDAAIERLEAIRSKLEEIKDLTSGNALDFGDYMRKIAQLFNPANFNVRQKPGEKFSDAVMRQRVEEEKKAEAEVAKWTMELNKRDAQGAIQLQAQNRANLEKEIKELRRQHENELFQLRQSLAQKEVEIFQAAGELRIYQMEQANKKLIEGEEGASKAALEALNTYLSTRERGEMQIETAKKTIAIEVANMEKSIADYRFEMEKKMFELRKRAAENDVASAQARQAAAEAGIDTNLSSGFLVGSTGRSTAPHLHLSSPTQDKESVIKEAFGIIREWQAKNVEYIVLGNTNTDVKNMKDDKQLMAALRSEQVVHGRRSNPSSVDIAVPAGTLVPVRSGTPSWDEGGGGWIATSLSTGNQMMHGLKESVANSGGAPASSSSSSKPPAVQGAPNLGDGKREAEAYGTAVRAVSSAMERLRSLQVALTEAKTVEAMEAIAKSVFDPVPTEDLRDSLSNLHLTFDAIMAVKEGVFDSEAIAVQTEALVKYQASLRELAQIDKAVNESTLLSAEQKSKILAQLDERHQKYIASLREEEVINQSMLAVQRGNDSLLRMRESTRAMYEELEILKLRNRLEYAGLSPERVNAEIQKVKLRTLLSTAEEQLTKALAEQLKIQKELQSIATPKAEKDKADLQRRLEDAAKTIKALQDQIDALKGEGKKQEDAIDDTAKNTPDKIQSLMGQWRQEISDTQGMVVSLAQTIQSELSTAMSSAITGVITGTTTVQQAFAQMFGNIGQAFVQMATEMITKAMMLKVLGLLFPGAAPAAGAGASGATALAAGSIGDLLGGAANLSFAGGGFTGYAPRIGGIDGQGGFPAILHPQETVIDHTQSMQRFRHAGGRAGSALGGASSPAGGASPGSPLEVSYHVTEINSMRFVTEDQFQAGMNQAARQGAAGGHARVLGDLRNRRSARSRLGLN